MPELQRRLDIAIVGGGPAGAAMGLALRGYPGSVAVFDAKAAAMTSADQDAAGLDRRNVALAQSSVCIFKSLGVWSRAAADACPIRAIHVSEKSAFGVIRICCEEEGLEALGWVVPYHRLNGILQQTLNESTAVPLLSPAKVISIDTQDHGAVLNVEYNGDVIAVQAKLVILADGRDSLRRKIGFKVRTRDYRQTAVIANVESETPAAGVAYERFTEHGLLAVLPLTGNDHGVVWVHKSNYADELLNLDEAEFIAALQKDCGRRIGKIRKVGKRACYPLQAAWVTNMVHGPVLALGNTAHTLHPVAGQSFNLTMRNLAWLAEALFKTPDNPADADILRNWELSRRKEVRRVIRFTDFLARAFRLPLVSPLRSCLMVTLDSCHVLRRTLVLRGLGLLPPASRLASGLPVAADSHD